MADEQTVLGAYRVSKQREQAAGADMRSTQTGSPCEQVVDAVRGERDGGRSLAERRLAEGD